MFEGKAAIVTGAGSLSGIGRQVALVLAEGGADVAVADVDLSGAQRVADEIETMGKRAIALHLDVCSEVSVKEMCQSVMSHFGRIDILVNNAGITQPIQVADMTLADFQRVLEVNLFGTFLCSKEVIAVAMAKQNYGRIVNLSSVSGKQGGGVYGGAHYSAAKAGILGFSKALAREVVGKNITVNCVSPGLIATDIRVGFPIEKERAIWETIPMKRPGTGREVAHAIAFLASDEASYITGEDIDINGGSYMD